MQYLYLNFAVIVVGCAIGIVYRIKKAMRWPVTPLPLREQGGVTITRILYYLSMITVFWWLLIAYLAILSLADLRGGGGVNGELINIVVSNPLMVTIVVCAAILAVASLHEHPAIRGE